MSSSCLINKSALVAIGAALAITAAGGCSKQGGSPQSVTGAKQAEPAAKAAPTRGFIRLAALEGQHPLQADVQRLRNAERRLAGLAPGIRSGPGLQDPYELPAVGTQIDRATAQKVAVALQNRRLRERSLLAKRTAAQLGAFIGGIGYREERLLDQRRAELEAIGQSEQERLARSIRDAAAEDIRNQVAGRTGEKLTKEINIGVTSKQLRPDPDFAAGVSVPEPVPDEQRLQDDIEKLTADPQAQFVVERARFVVRLRRLQRELQELQAQIGSIETTAKKSAEERILAAKNARLAEIELELEGLRNDAETLFLFRSQRAALANALAAEADVAARTASFQGLSGESRDGAGAVRFASLFGTRPEATGSASRALDLKRALQRVVTQRERLQRFIRVDVRDAAQDAAETHNVDLTFAPDAGRRDMTAEFGTWLRGNSRGSAAGTAQRASGG
jgi:hypothetical protein